MSPPNITRKDFDELLEREEREAFPWEWKTADEISARKLRKPETNLGEGRARFWRLLARTGPAIARGDSICDFGAYPGTYLRAVRAVGGHRCRLAAAGFGFSDEFLQGMKQIEASVLEMEFDIRYPSHSRMKHILSYPSGRDAEFDIAVCTEVIEHQMYPLSLLTGINRFLRAQGRLYLTTNSVSFVGDILKLAVGRHNVEALDRSHVISDSLWRPHIRLYTASELRRLLAMSGFTVREALYYDNGSVYRGLKGLGTAAIRGVAGIVPHLRSHIFITAEKTGEPGTQARRIVEETIRNYDLDRVIHQQPISSAEIA